MKGIQRSRLVNIFKDRVFSAVYGRFIHFELSACLVDYSQNRSSEISWSVKAQFTTFVKPNLLLYLRKGNTFFDERQRLSLIQIKMIAEIKLSFGSSFTFNWKQEQELLRWLTKVFRRLVARAMIACQTSVLIARAQMTQATPIRNENHFSTWKALNHFGIRSNSFKLRSKICLSLGPKKYDQKLDKQPVKELQIILAFFALDTWLHMRARLNEGHAQFNSRPRL